MTTRLADFLRTAEKQLAASCIDNPAFDARFLVGRALGLDRGQLFSESERLLTDDEISQAQGLLDRRAAYEPVARITGEREFWGLPFGLNEATLEPRPDSEILVEAALKSFPQKDLPLKILDLGTGTGCLLLSLLHDFPFAQGTGLDIAPRAIEQAERNATNLGLKDRAFFKTNNWLENINERFDLIIANPPYISRDEILALMPEVRDHDPIVALDGGDDGLSAYRLLIPQLSSILNPGGVSVFEVGYNQAEAVSSIFQRQGFQSITKHKDYGGIERCLTAVKLA